METSITLPWLDKETLAELEPVIKKTIAIASGKGGVGKTTTAANLAVYYAKKGMNVALFDLDPLSDVSTILDIESMEKIAGKRIANTDTGEFKNNIIQVFPNLSLFTPQDKQSQRATAGYMEKIYNIYSKELTEIYDIIILDMPAGSDIEENISYLPLAGMLIIVTNPEPTAHVSAGAYIKKVTEYIDKIDIYLWHNRYHGFTSSNFHPQDVILNYNNNVAEEDQITEIPKDSIHQLAFIPNDPSLNLLRSNPALTMNVQRNLLDISEAINEVIIRREGGKLPIGDKIFQFIASYIIQNPEISDPETYLQEMGEYLKQLVFASVFQKGFPLNTKNLDLFSAEEKKDLLAYLHRLKASLLRKHVVSLKNLLEQEIQAENNAEKLFSAKMTGSNVKAIDRQLTKVLTLLNNFSITTHRDIRNHASMLLFYFSLYKLLQSETVLKVILDFIPKRGRDGKNVRDRYTQIKSIVTKDEEYKKRYFALIKSLYPVVVKQVTSIVETFKFKKLLFHESNGQINKRAYVKLLTNFIHDSIHSGLGLIVGFDYRSASSALKKGAEKALDILY
ncbi:MAG: AAA family ATPase [Spirochaetia bacterium]